MAAIESPETVGIRPFHEFDEAHKLWPRGERPAAMREAAQEFRARFKEQGQIRAVRTIDLASAGYPTAFALAGAAKGLTPFVNIRNRLVVVQFEDFEGEMKTLVWEPTIPEGSVEAPFYEQLLERYGEFLSYKLFGKIFNSVEEGLAMCGLHAEEVDFVSFAHLHVQDMRLLIDTTEPMIGEAEARKPFFPNAKFVNQRKE